MKRFVMAGILVLLGVVCGASLVRAQVPTSTILGVVKDTSGGVVPEANVTVRNTDTNATRTIVTGDDGAFRVPALQPGHYSVTVEKSGFNTQTRAGLELVVDQELPVNVALAVGASTQEITVTEEAPQVNTTTSSLGGLVNEAKLEDLPLNGRNFVDLASLQAGVTNATGNSTFSGTSGSAFSSNGAPVRSNNFTLDGAPMANVRGVTAGAVGTTLGVDGIKEYKVITSAFSAEYGLNMGSQVVLVSKGGTNQWHGDAFDYLRNASLDARNFFDSSHVTTGKRLPGFQRNQFGASGGGPIQKDKTFFYAVYEGLRARQGATINDTVFAPVCHTALVPNAGNYAFDTTAHATACASGLQGLDAVAPNVPSVIPAAIKPFLDLYPNPNLPGTNKFFDGPKNPTDVDYGQIRVDHTFSDKDSMFGRYTTQAGRNQSETNYPGLATAITGRDQWISVAENHIFSPTVLNTARASYSRSPILANVILPTALMNPPYQLVAGQFMGSFTITGVTGLSPSSNTPSTLTTEGYTLSDDLFYTKGRHAFKFGTLLNRFEYYTLSVNYNRGQISFNSIASFLQGMYTQNIVETPGSNQTRAPRFYTYGFYAQDDWRVTSRLTANLGLRYEPASVPIDRTGLNWAFRSYSATAPVNGAPFLNATYKNFSPRVGLAWDVRGNGKTSVRAAFGEYYDVSSAGFSFYTTAQGSPPTSTQITFPAGTINAANPATPGGNLPFLVAGQPGTTIRGAQYNPSSPHLLQWNLTVEQQVTPNTAFTISYVGTRGIHLYTTEDTNPCVPLSITNGVPYWGTTACGSTPTSAQRQNFGGPNLLGPNGLPQPWGDAIFTTTGGASNYNALQATITKRLSHGLEITGAYTYSHVLDNTQGLFFGSECSAGGNMNIQSALPGLPNASHIFNYGPACFDIQQYLRVQVLYHLPSMKGGNSLLRGVANGWWLGDITSWQSGFPITPQISNWRSNDLYMNQLSSLQTDHPNLGTATIAGTGGAAGLTFIPYNPATVITGNPNQWFNPLMFTLNPVGNMGNAGRGILRGPHLNNFDFSLNKDTNAPFLGEAGKVVVRAEFFNIFNKANFSLPNNYIYAGKLTDAATAEAPPSTAGQITTTNTASRQIQVSLKVIF